MTEILVVLVTVGNSEEAAKIAQTLVQEKLVACVNIIPQIRSIYRWKGEVCDDQELLLMMKTQAALFPTLQKRIRALHSYEVPEIVGFPLLVGSPDYLNWVLENTTEEK